MKAVVVALFRFLVLSTVTLFCTHVFLLFGLTATTEVPPPQALALAFPVAVMLGTGVAIAGVRRRDLGWRWLYPAVILPACVAVAMVVAKSWLVEDADRLAAAVNLAIDERGFPVTSAVWRSMEWFIALLLFPVLMMTFVVDLVILPLLVFTHPQFLWATGVLLFRSGLLAAVGVAVGVAASRPLLGDKRPVAAEPPAE